MSSYHLPQPRDAVPKKVIEKMALEDPTLFNRKKCSKGVHEKTKTHADQWIDRTIPISRVPIFDEDGVELKGFSEMGMCKDCGSTLVWHEMIVAADQFEKRDMKKLLEG